MLISNKYRFIFVHVHKVAGQSITNALIPYAAEPWQKYLSTVIPYRIQLKVFTKIKQYGGKGFSPQPFADHISGPVLRDALGAARFDQYFSFAFVRNPWDWVLSQYTYAKKNPRHHMHKKYNSFQNFNEFCRWHCTENPSIKFQKNYVFDKKGRQVVNFIGKQEYLRRDFKYVCEQIGINAVLPHYNQSRKESYQKHYSDESMELVSRTFSEDIRLLSY